MTVQVTLPSNFCILPSILSFWLDLFSQQGPEFNNMGCGKRANQLSCLRLSYTRYYSLSSLFFSNLSFFRLDSAKFRPSGSDEPLLNHFYVQVCMPKLSCLRLSHTRLDSSSIHCKNFHGFH